MRSDNVVHSGGEFDELFMPGSDPVANALLGLEIVNDGHNVSSHSPYNDAYYNMAARGNGTRRQRTTDSARPVYQKQFGCLDTRHNTAEVLGFNEGEIALMEARQRGVITNPNVKQRADNLLTEFRHRSDENKMACHSSDLAANADGSYSNPRGSQGIHNYNTNPNYREGHHRAGGSHPYNRPNYDNYNYNNYGAFPFVSLRSNTGCGWRRRI